MGVSIFGIVILVSIGAFLGMALSALFASDDPELPDFDALRDAYEEGLLHGHLTTRAGTFERQEIGAMADEWLNRQIDDGNLPSPV
ncbi:hypothetical protein ACWJKU_01395 [Methylocaldum sp. MU1018]